MGTIPEERKATAARSVSPRRLPRALRVATWCYAGVILGTLAAVRGTGGSWWVVAVLLFLPRWLFLLPLAGLAALSGLQRRYGDWVPQSAVFLVIAGPLMGVSLPIGRLWKAEPAGERLLMATFNMAITGARVDEMEAWAGREAIDILCLQESNHHSAKLRAFLRRGWFANRRMTVLSRWPITAELESLPENSDTEKRYGALLDRVRIRSPRGNEFVVGSVHMPTIRPGFYRLRDGSPSGLELHLDWWRTQCGRVMDSLGEPDGLQPILAGDFNMPSDDASMDTLHARFRFGFEEAGWGYGYTRPTRLPWVRIDHVLAGRGWAFVRCGVGPDLGSDHLPVAAELVIQP